MSKKGKYTIYEDYLLYENDKVRIRVYYCENQTDWDKYLNILKKEGYKYFSDFDYVPTVKKEYFPLMIFVDSAKTYSFTRIDGSRELYEKEEWFTNWMKNINRKKKLKRILG